MPLPYATTTPLIIPADAFNADGLAMALLHGLRAPDYVWTFQLHPAVSPTSKPADALAMVYGALTASMEIRSDPYHTARDTAFRDSPQYRDRALESAVFWTITETQRLGWRLAHMDSEDESVIEQYRPVQIIATLFIANERFIPDPGYPLLDERIAGTRS